MNLPVLAVMLQERQLSSIHISQRVVSCVNDVIKDCQFHIDQNMTGKQIYLIYKSLDYDTQSVITNIELCTLDESLLIASQLELIDDVNVSKHDNYKRTKQKALAVINAVLVAIVLVYLFNYHTSAVQHKNTIKSNVLDLWTTLEENIEKTK